MTTLHRSLLSAILIALTGAFAASAKEASPAIHGSILGTIAENSRVALTETTPDPGLEAQRQFLDLNLKVGHLNEAAQNANAILSRDPKDAQALEAMVTIHSKRGENPAAVRQARTLAKHHPGPQSDLVLVGALRQSGDYQAALAILDKLRRTTPAGRPFPHQLEIAYTYYDARDIATARRHFTTVRNDHRYLPNQRAEAGRQLAAIDRDNRLVAAYEAIEQRDLKRARQLVTALEKSTRKPSHDIIALKAILDADQFGKVQEAADTFATLEKKTPAGKPFPYGTAYAMQLVDLRRYASAERVLMQAGDRQASQLTPDDIASHRDSLRFVRQFTHPDFSLVQRFEDRAEGNARRLDVDGSLPFRGGLTRLGVDVTYHDLDIPNPADDRYYSSFLTARHQLSRNLHASAALGAVAGDFAWRTSLAWTRPTQDSHFEITLASGQRPTDTLRLESLGATEDRLSASASVAVPQNRRLRLKADAFLRSVDLDTPGVGSLGNGWAARVELEYLLYLHKRARVTASYFVAVEEFDFKSSLDALAAGTLPANPRDLLEESYQSTGIILAAQAPVGSRLTAHASAGLDYRFETDELVYMIGGGLEYWLNDNARLELDAAYYSSGTAGNAADGYFEGRIGLDLTL